MPKQINDQTWLNNKKYMDLQNWGWGWCFGDPSFVHAGKGRFNNMRKECQIKTFNGLDSFSYVCRMIKIESNTTQTPTGEPQIKSVGASGQKCWRNLGGKLHWGSLLRLHWVSQYKLMLMLTMPCSSKNEVYSCSCSNFNKDRSVKSRKKDVKSAKSCTTRLDATCVCLRRIAWQSASKHWRQHHVKQFQNRQNQAKKHA